MPNLPDTIKPGQLDLVGIDGNAFAIMGAVRRSLRRADNTPEDIDAVMAAMTAGNYDDLLCVAVTVTEPPETDDE